MSAYDQRRKLSFAVQEDQEGGTSVLPIPRSTERDEEEKQQQMSEMAAIQDTTKEMEFSEQLMQAIQESPEAQARIDDAMGQVSQLMNGPETQGMDQAAILEMLPQMLQGGQNAQS